MPLARNTCRSCGQPVPAGASYCVSCAIRNADSDATVFDRWLAIAFVGGGLIAAVLALYLAARYFNILA